MRGGAVAAITAQRRQRNGSAGSFGGSSRSSSEGNSSSLSSSMTSMLGAVKKKATQTASVAGTVARQGMDVAKDKLGISRTSQEIEETPLHRADLLEEVQGIQETDTDDLKQLVGMGFARAGGIWALRQVGAGNVQGAALLLSSELADSEVLTREAEHEGELEGDTGNDKSVGWWGEARWESPFEPGTWVQCHGFESEEARVLNGKVGQVIRYNPVHQRFIVTIRGEQEMIRPANLKKASKANSVHAEMKASLKGTMGSMQEMRRKAGALLSTSKSKNESLDCKEEEVVPVDPAKRGAALKAAEQRMAATKAKSGGTMEDWRRQQHFSQESRLLEMRKNQQKQTLSSGSCEESVAPSLEVETIEMETGGPTIEPLAMDLEPELLDVAEGDLEKTVEEHEALMEEQFEMQQALALSLESGRDLLDQDRVEQACANAESARDETTPETNHEDNDQRQDLSQSIQPVEVRDKSEEHAMQEPSQYEITPEANHDQRQDWHESIQPAEVREKSEEHAIQEPSQDEITPEANHEVNDQRQDSHESIQPVEVREKSEEHALQEPSHVRSSDTHIEEQVPEQIHEHIPAAHATELQSHANADVLDAKSEHEEIKAEVGSLSPSVIEEAPRSINAPPPGEQLEAKEASVQEDEGCMNARKEVD